MTKGTLVGNIASLLDRSGRRAYLALTALSVLSSILQTIGVASISLFFTAMLGGNLPDVITDAFPGISFQSMGLLVLTCTLAGTASSAGATYLGIRLSWRQYHVIAHRLLAKYVLSPYEWHLQQNSSSLIKTVITDVNYVVIHVLQQVILIIVRGSEILFISLLLIASQPLTALAATGSFLVIYGLLFSVKSSSMRSQGAIVHKENAERQKSATEALGGIKSVKVAQNHGYFLKRFQSSAVALGDAQSRLQYLSLLPKYLVEALLFGGVVGFILLSHSRGWDNDESIAILALYGAAAIRMLPAAQQVYASIVILSGAKPILDNICNSLLEETKAEKPVQFGSLGVTGDDVLLRLEGVGYAYPESERPSVRDINLAVKRGEKIGIVGATGAGKTTLVDLILGLLPAQHGYIARGDHGNGAGPFCAYVPQHLHFIDDTIAANIAIGIESEKRDFERITAAAIQAHIHRHIDSLPASYETQMGEQGIRLSGGQRQRLGIARALYHTPSLLVLDEASNALDADTERQVVGSLLESSLTVVIIAHRISLLKGCDRIVVLSGGTIEEIGSYEELLGSSPTFRLLAQADALETAEGLT